MTRHAPDAGFTLLELLVGVTLLAFMSVALAAGLRFGTRIWNKTESSDIDTNAIRAAQNLVAQNLARIYPKFIVASPADSYVDFTGSPHRMEFLSTADRVSGQMTRVALYAAGDNDDLTMEHDSLPELAWTGAAGKRQILLRHLEKIDFAYFGASGGEKTPQWHTNWQHEASLPLLIRVRATTPRASAAWSELIVSPKIAADISCTYNAITKRCQGRQ